MNIVLVLAPVINRNLCPIGLACLKSYIEHHTGHKVKILNLNKRLPAHKENDIEYWTDPNNAFPFIKKNKEVFDKWISEILACDPDVVGFSVWNTAKYPSIYIAEQLKQKKDSTFVVFGGYDCSIKGSEYISHKAIDAVVGGEGEVTFMELIKAVESGSMPDKLIGAHIKKGDSTVYGGRREEIEDLNSLPFPDYSDFANITELPLAFNRGCKNRCRYCHISAHMVKFRTRSPRRIYEEMRFQKDKYPDIKMFHQGDVSKLQDLDVLSQVCDLMINDDFIIRWEDWTSLDPALDMKLLNKMKSAGCRYLCYGLESGSQKIADLMGKKIKIEEAERIIKDTFNAGIAVGLNIIVGFPGENEVDFNETLDFIKRNIRYIRGAISASTCRLLDYSSLCRNPDKYNIKIENKQDIHNWTSDNGSNTPEIRKQRLKIVNDLIEEYEKERSLEKAVSQLYHRKTPLLSKAVKEYYALLKIYPHNINANIELAYLHEKLNDNLSAIKNLNEAVRKGHENHRVFFTLTRLYLSEGDYPKAVIFADKALYYEPGNYDAYIVKGKGLAGQDKLEEALNCYSKARNLQKDRWEAYAETAVVHERMGNIKSMLAFIKKSVSRGFDNELSCLILGRYYLAAGKAEEALKELKKSIKRGSKEAHIFTGKCLAFMGEDRQAINHLKKALIFFPEQTSIYRDISNIFIKSGDFKNAEIQLKTAIKKDRQNIEVILDLSRLYLRKNQFQNAHDLLNSVNTDSYYKLVLKGRALIGLKEFQKAAKILNKAASAQKDNSLALIELAQVYELKQDYSSAAVFLDKALSVSAASSHQHERLGHFYKRSGDLVRAAAAFKTALQHNKNNYEASIMLAKCYFENDEPEKSEHEYKHAIEIDGKRMEAYQGLSTIFQHREDLEQSAKYLKKAIDKGYRNQQAYFNMANMCFSSGDLDNALIYIRKALRTNPKSPDIHLFAARIYKDLKKTDSALQELQTAIDLDPRNPDAYRETANIFENLGKPDKALIYMKKAAVCGQKDPALFFDYGRLYLEQGKYRYALRYFKKAIENSKPGYGLLIHAARSAIKIKEYDQAAAFLKKAARIADGKWEHYTEKASLYENRNDYKKAITVLEQALKISGPRPELLRWISVLKNKKQQAV